MTTAATSTRLRSTRISWHVTLGLIVLAASAAHVLLALEIASPWIVPDEIRYAELAKSLGDLQLPSIRGHVTFGYGLGYPLLLAPLWALFNDVALAYTAAKVVNAVVLGLTAVPAYFLARRFLAESAALVAAALSVTIPSLLYAGMLMTEVALYPTFVLALLAIAVALERPTRATQLAMFGAVALASAVKVLAAALLVGYLAAVLLFHWLDTRHAGAWLRRLRAYRPTLIVLAAMLLLCLAYQVVAARSPTVVLGTYRPYLEAANLVEIPRWMFFHVAAFDFFIAVIPFAATALVIGSGLRARADRSARLLAVMCLTLSAPIFAAVAAYSSVAGRPVAGYASGAGANERATFVLAPLALIGLMVWLRDRPGSRIAVVIASVGAAFLPAAIPLHQFAENVVKVQAFSLIAFIEAPEITHGRVGLGLVALILGCVFLVLALGRARDVAFVAPVIVAFVLATLVAQTFLEFASEDARSAGVGDSPAWIDRIAHGDKVSVLWYEPPGKPWAPLEDRHRIVWLNEFFNRTVGDVYELGSPMPYGVDLPTIPARLSAGRVLLEDGAPARLGPLVLAPCYVWIAGEVVARDARTGATVYRVEEPVRAAVSAPHPCTT